MKFTHISSACPLPAVRPGCSRCIALEFLLNKGDHAGFTKPLL